MVATNNAIYKETNETNKKLHAKRIGKSELTRQTRNWSKADVLNGWISPNS